MRPLTAAAVCLALAGAAAAQTDRSAPESEATEATEDEATEGEAGEGEAGEGDPAERRALEGAETETYRAVGRLNIAGSRFCTATLIGERLVLTAAHCLFHPRSGRPVELEDLRFAPGAQRKRDLGVWRVARLAMAPGFALAEAPRPEDLRADVALLELDAPVDGEVATPFATGPLLQEDPPPRIVSYARDRARAPSINAACPPLGMVAEVLVVACAIERGVSGAPVLAGEGPDTRVVAVVSSMGRLPNGDEFTLAVAVAPWIAALREELAEAAPAPGEE